MCNVFGLNPCRHEETANCTGKYLQPCCCRVALQCGLPWSNLTFSHHPQKESLGPPAFHHWHWGRIWGDPASSLPPLSLLSLPPLSPAVFTSLHPPCLFFFKLVLGVKQTSVLLFESCPGPSLGANLLLKRFFLPAASTCIHTRRQSSASQRAQIRLIALTHLSGSWLLPLLFLLLLLLSESQQRGWLRCSLKTKLIFYFGNPEEKATSALCPRVTLASLFEKAPHPIISAHLGKLPHARAQSGSQSLRVVLFRLCVCETLNMLPLSDATLADTHTHMRRQD